MSLNNQERLRYLLKQYASGQISEAEMQEIAGLLKEDSHDRDIELVLQQMAEQMPADLGYDRVEVERMVERILRSSIVEAKVIPMGQGRRKSFIRYAAAAIIIVMLGASAYLLFFNATGNKQQATNNQQQGSKNDIAPGRSGATLTLQGGKTINLDSAARGELALQGSTTLISQADKLVYKGMDDGGTVFYNTVTTARGNDYQLILSDGSKVWLNAGSSLKFPASFTGKQRAVQLSGEAYFEIAHDASKPFIVSKGGVSVTVLGTHFNINAYDDDENLKVTLLEGSVKVSKGSISKMIKPGEQATVIADNKQPKIKVADANTDETIAWKEGYFHFESADLKTILKQFARWYDMEVVYEGAVSNEKFFSVISRDTPLSNVLKSLQANGVRYRIEGKKLYVMSQ